MANALILFWVGPYRLAIPATELKEIRQDSRLACLGQAEVAPEKRDAESPLSVRALFQLSPKPGGCTLVLREQTLSLQVDRVERMIETCVIHNLPRAFQGEERLWFKGITLADDSVIPILNPKALSAMGNEAAR
ncbi:MAG TPA: chemotaxis protein CheW [Terriglobia bacterium]|nr:chemotaxis protein CheW [Terriglobia bacterium]